MEDIDLLLDLCDNIAPGLTWPPNRRRSVSWDIDSVVGSLGHPDVPRRLRGTRDERRVSLMTDVIRSTVTLR